MTYKTVTVAAVPGVLAAALAASALLGAGPAGAAPSAPTAATAAAISTRTATGFTFAWPTVRQGSRGEAVVALQYLLRARGSSPGAIDGIFGRGTRAAVVRFQASRRLAADGVAGARTWAALVFTVRPGSTGDGVRAAQSELTANGYHVAVDGAYGPRTLAAAHAFQARYRLAGALGQIDIATWNALISHGR